MVHGTIGHFSRGASEVRLHKSFFFQYPYVAATSGNFFGYLMSMMGQILAWKKNIHETETNQSNNKFKCFSDYHSFVGENTFTYQEQSIYLPKPNPDDHSCTLETLILSLYSLRYLPQGLMSCHLFLICLKAPFYKQNLRLGPQKWRERRCMEPYRFFLSLPYYCFHISCVYFRFETIFLRSCVWKFKGHEDKTFFLLFIQLKSVQKKRTNKTRT